ncbi:MAG TPA: hypothetical protein VG734_10145 [Lacunisphaera sp.]|nr:hypothetical protein [Lacunisphaera sp.]
MPPVALSRTAFCSVFLLVATLVVAGPIDRQAVVERHTIRLNRVDVESPLSVGNGDFAFTVDPTGLQTFEYFHDEGIPLETSSTLPWAWHEFPNPQGLKLEDAMMPHDFHGRTVMFAGRQNSPAGTYFRENPHPIPLGQISLWLDGRVVEAAELTKIDQTLNPWSGIIRSAYTLGGEPVVVETVAHATAAAAGIRIESPLVRAGRLAVHFRFPYSYKLNSRNKPPFAWDHPDKHRTTIIRSGDGYAELGRELDASRYFALVKWDGPASFAEVAPHHFKLEARDTGVLGFACEFAPLAPDAGKWLTFDQVRASSVAGWRDYWTRGGIIDLAGSTDPRAKELERRIILSLYLVKVNYAGSFPPSEDGLTNITWFGKHHSEMYYWHAAHFSAWGRTELLEKSLAWYKDVLLPAGLKDAQAQGFEGVRWAKMSGIDGRTGPGTINPYIIWNQPNPIALSELVYRAKPTRETLEKYQDVVFESARFLASFAYLDPKTDRYVLGPPIKNVSESSGANLTQNPTFELAYWYYGLKVAQRWRERLGLAPDPKWADVLAKLSKLPVSPEGYYVEIETFPDIYSKEGGAPTSMLMALGFMPPTEMVDVETMRKTFHEVTRRNGGVDSWVSWAYGQGALTAARLNEPQTAIDILCNPRPAARFMTNGHVRRPKEPDNCPAYLPVNSAFLLAVATMAGGWDGAPEGNAPGFPRDGKWVVRSEGLSRMP